MFNLDQEIAEWRRRMMAAGIKTPVPLDELESHLREDFERHLVSGVNPRQAFEAVIQRMGQAHALNTEFWKVAGATGKEEIRRTIMILAGLAGVLFGFGGIWPQLGMLHRTGSIAHLEALLAGAAIVIAAGSVTFYNIRRHKEAHGRKLVAICLIAVGGLCSAVNVSTFFELSATEWLWWPPIVAAIVLFFGSCLYFNRTPRSQPTQEA
jgi:hypothetical protein